MIIIPPDTKPPFRLAVQLSLTSSLEEITPANKFLFDLSGKVKRGRLTYDDDDPMPLISILEAPIPQDPAPSRGPNPNSTGLWELLIQGFIDDDPDNPTDPAHFLMAEVKRRLVAEKRRETEGRRDILGFKGKVDDLMIGQGAVRPSDPLVSKGFFWLTVWLKLVEDLNDPYAY